MIWYIDPELRRALLTEIAFQRSERSKFRGIADDEANPYGVQRKAAYRADGCNRAIRALRDVWDATADVERRRATAALADPMDGALIRRFDVLVPVPAALADWAPGELVEAFGK